MVKFGIVIATYKRKDGSTPFVLNKCLNSIKNQTYQNFKIFLIGDKYEDDEEFNRFGDGLFGNDQILKKNLPFANERDKYKDLNALWSYGGWYASNHGIDIAMSENINYICRLDHDDFWSPNHLKNFNDCIINYGAQFVCSLSSHFGNRVLPIIPKSNQKFIPFIPKPMGCIKSSTCVNQDTIPLRTRNIFEETGKVGLPGDADLWGRMNQFIIEKKYPSFVVNEMTCFHDDEGHTKRQKII